MNGIYTQEENKILLEAVKGIVYRITSLEEKAKERKRNLGKKGKIVSFQSALNKIIFDQLMAVPGLNINDFFNSIHVRDLLKRYDLLDQLNYYFERNKTILLEKNKKNISNIQISTKIGNDLHNTLPHSTNAVDKNLSDKGSLPSSPEISE